MKFKLNDKQLEKIADLVGDMGLIVLASVAIPSFFDKFNLWVVVVGIMASIFCWALSVRLLKSA